MATSLLKRAPLPGVYGIPPFAYRGRLVLRRVANPVDFDAALVQFDRGGLVVQVDRYGYRTGAASRQQVLGTDLFAVHQGAEYFAIGFAQMGQPLIEWPRFSVVFELQG